MMDGSSRSEFKYARSFRELVVWQRARVLQRGVFEASKKFPREEMYSLTDQMRRAARSIGAQVAEAWGKRDYERHFVSKLSDADAEQMETQHWLITAADDGYLFRDEAKPLFQLCQEVGRILYRMKEQSALFCPEPEAHRLHEDPAEFFAPPTEH